MDTPLSYRPSAHYYRREIRALHTKAEVLDFALLLVLEIERHKAWIRAKGLIPPKWLVTPGERGEKLRHPGEVVPFPTIEPESATGV